MPGFIHCLEFIFLDPAPDACAAEYGELINAAWDDEGALRELGERLALLGVRLEVRLLAASVVVSEAGVVREALTALAELGLELAVVSNSDGTVDSGVGDVVILGGDHYARISVFGAGGTQVLYLAGVEFEKLGLPNLGDEGVGELSRNIQHGIYQGFVAPAALYAILGAAMWRNKRQEKRQAEGGEE